MILVLAKRYYIRFHCWYSICNFIHVSHSVYFYGNIMICSYVICTCTIPLFLHTYWEFWLPKFAHPNIWVFLLLSRYLRRSCVSEEYRVSFAWSPDSLVQFMSFFYPVDFYWFSIAWTLFLFYWFIHRITLSCVEFICYIAVVTMIIIVDLYNLFKSL